MKIVAALVAAALFASGGMSAPCRDAKGKFVKCPTAAAKAVRCKDAKGRFAKCGSPGANPA